MQLTAGSIDVTLQQAGAAVIVVAGLVVTGQRHAHIVATHACTCCAPQSLRRAEAVELDGRGEQLLRRAR